MSVFLFIIILATLVLVHELGHFIAAKRAGIRVDEFGIGFPPRLFSKKVGETLYSINLFPLGGFVKIFGETPDCEPIDEASSAQSLIRKPKPIQAWVMAAGIVFNLVFAWLVLSLGFMVGMPYSVDDSAYAARVKDPELTITQVLPNSPAEIAGIKVGDKITALTAGSIVRNHPEIKEAQDFISSRNEVLVTRERGTEITTIRVRPQNGTAGPRRTIGVSLDMIGTLRLPPLEALYAGMTTAASMTSETVVGLFDFFKNVFIGRANFAEISGPVGIVSVVRDASALGFAHLVSLVAIISINLAVINLLPFPALDGGRLFFLLIETVKRSPIKPKFANMANSVGFALLIVLMIAVTYNDVAKIIHG